MLLVRFAPVGIALLLPAFALLWIFGKGLPARQLPRIFPEMKLRHLTAWKGGSVSPSLVMASLNAFSMSWICVLMSQVILFMAFQPEPRRGLWILWEKPTPITSTENPWSQTMSVYVGSPGQFYINGEFVTRERFEGTLREELSRRVEWTVYVEADPDTQFMDTVYAIDTIQGLGAKVFWITPQMRQEWKRGSGWSSPRQQ